jgi:hypothetical protein
MPIEYRDILMDGYQEIDAEQAQLVAELEAARMNDDSEGVRAARRRILELDGQRDNLTRRANLFVAAQNAPQAAPGFGDDVRRDHVELARQYGLNASEIGVAVNWTQDPHMSDEVKVKRYVENRHRLRQARADGSYRDDQGRR